MSKEIRIAINKGLNILVMIEEKKKRGFTEFFVRNPKTGEKEKLDI